MKKQEKWGTRAIAMIAFAALVFGGVHCGKKKKKNDDPKKGSAHIAIGATGGTAPTGGNPSGIPAASPSPTHSP